MGNGLEIIHTDPKQRMVLEMRQQIETLTGLSLNIPEDMPLDYQLETLDNLIAMIEGARVQYSKATRKYNLAQMKLTGVAERIVGAVFCNNGDETRQNLEDCKGKLALAMDEFETAFQQLKHDPFLLPRMEYIEGIWDMCSALREHIKEYIRYLPQSGTPDYSNTLRHSKDALETLRSFVRENNPHFQKLLVGLNDVRDRRGNRPNMAKRSIGNLAKQYKDKYAWERGVKVWNAIYLIPTDDVKDMCMEFKLLCPAVFRTGHPVTDKTVWEKGGKTKLGVYISEAEKAKALPSD